MKKKLTRTGNSVALVLDVLVVTPLRDRKRRNKFRKSVEKVNLKYAGLFRRLSE